MQLLQVVVQVAWAEQQAVSGLKKLTAILDSSQVVAVVVQAVVLALVVQVLMAR